MTWPAALPADEAAEAADAQADSSREGDLCDFVSAI
jgi:hypothetical protein